MRIMGGMGGVLGRLQLAGVADAFHGHWTFHSGLAAKLENKALIVSGGGQEERADAAILLLDIRFFPIAGGRTRMSEGLAQCDPGAQAGRRGGGGGTLPGMPGQQTFDPRVRGIGADGEERKFGGFLEIELELAFAALLHDHFPDDGAPAIGVFELADVRCPGGVWRGEGLRGLASAEGEGEAREDGRGQEAHV